MEANVAKRAIFENTEKGQVAPQMSLIWESDILRTRSGLTLKFGEIANFDVHFLLILDAIDYFTYCKNFGWPPSL